MFPGLALPPQQGRRVSVASTVSAGSGAGSGHGSGYGSVRHQSGSGSPKIPVRGAKKSAVHFTEGSSGGGSSSNVTQMGSSSNKEKLPPKMSMRYGDQYLVPQSVNIVKVGLQWEHLTQTHVDVDASAVMCTKDGKKLDHVSYGRKHSREHSVSHSGDDKGHDRAGDDESIIIHLDKVPKECVTLLILLNVYTTNKTLDDVANLVARVAMLERKTYVDDTNVSEFSQSVKPQTRLVETVELCRYKYIPDRPKLRGMVFLAIQRRIPSGPSGVNQQGAVWRVLAAAAPVQGRSHRHVTIECEAIGKKLAEGWTPVATGYRTGGDIDAHDKLRHRAQQLRRRSVALAALPAEDIHFAGDDEEDEERGSDDEGGAHHSSDDEDLDTMTPDALEEALFEQLFLYQRGGKSKRPRVIRKAKRLYSVGKAFKGTTRFDADDEDDDSDADEELFHSFFPGYANAYMMRYADRCYNMGTKKDQLLAHYMRHQAEYQREQAALAQQAMEKKQEQQASAEKPPDDDSSDENGNMKRKDSTRLPPEVLAMQKELAMKQKLALLEGDDARSTDSQRAYSRRPDGSYAPHSSGGPGGAQGGGGSGPNSARPSTGGRLGSARRLGSGDPSSRGASARSSRGGRPSRQLSSLMGSNAGFQGSGSGPNVLGVRSPRRPAGTSPGRRQVSPKKNQTLNIGHLLSGDLRKWIQALLEKQEERAIVPGRTGSRRTSTGSRRSDVSDTLRVLTPSKPSAPNPRAVEDSSAPPPAVADTAKPSNASRQQQQQQQRFSDPPNPPSHAGSSSSPTSVPWERADWPPQEPFLLKDDDDSTTLPQLLARTETANPSRSSVPSAVGTKSHSQPPIEITVATPQVDDDDDF